MTKIVTVLFLVLALSGCAHKELKAPCSNLVSLTADTVPCDERQPLNRTLPPSVFAN